MQARRLPPLLSMMRVVVELSKGQCFLGAAFLGAGFAAMCAFDALVPFEAPDFDGTGFANGFPAGLCAIDVAFETGFATAVLPAFGE
jgi:hypothetical protein